MLEVSIAFFNILSTTGRPLNIPISLDSMFPRL